MNTNLTTEQLQLLTDEANEFMESSGRKLFPTAKIDELRELGAKRCSKCATVKLIESFHKLSSRRDGLYPRCSDCNRAISADYRERNPDKVLEYDREYREQNRVRLNEYFRTKYRTDEICRLRNQLRQGYHRAVRSGNEASWIEPEELLTFWAAKDIDQLRCYITGATLTPFDRSLDHVVSIGNGGGHTVANLLPCTFEANQRKSNLEPDDVKDVIPND